LPRTRIRKPVELRVSKGGAKGIRTPDLLHAMQVPEV
jgi:hypothetical protein